MAKKATNSVSIPVVAGIVGGAFLLLSMARNKGRSSTDEGLSYLGESSLPRGMRNNNPGNIKKNAANSWKGKIANGTDPVFEQFETFALGTRALVKLLQNYIDRGNNTVSKIIARWAPAGVDNNPTSSYAAWVAQKSGLGLNTTLKPDKSTLRRLTQAIADYENGQSGVVSDGIFETAYSLL